MLHFSQAPATQIIKYLDHYHYFSSSSSPSPLSPHHHHHHHHHHYHHRHHYYYHHINNNIVPFTLYRRRYRHRFDPFMASSWTSLTLYEQIISCSGSYKVRWPFTYLKMRILDRKGLTISSARPTLTALPLTAFGTLLGRSTSQERAFYLYADVGFPCL